MPKKIQHGGLQTFNQRISNCVSHAESRCIYRIFKYLQENNNIFKNAPEDSPFKDFNIIHNEEHAKEKYYNDFEDMQYDLDNDLSSSKDKFIKYLNEKKLDEEFDEAKANIYEQMFNVQNNQKEIYFTILPILTYAYIFNIVGRSEESEESKDRIIKYNNDDNVFMSIKHIKEMKFNEEEKQTIINIDNEYSKQYFYKFNYLILNNEIKNNIQAMKTLNEQIEKFNALISLIPPNLTFRKYHYKNIDDYLTNLTTTKNPIFGIFHFSQDLLKEALEQREKKGAAPATFNIDSIFGHSVAIYNLEKKNKNEYVLVYKNSFDEVLGDNGKDELEFTKNDLNNDFYKKNKFPIQAWALEKIDNKNMVNESNLEEIAKLTVNGTEINEEIPAAMAEKVNNNFIKKLYNGVQINTKLIEEQIKYLNKKGITDENIKEVLNKYNTIMGYMKNYEIPIDKIETIITKFINKLYNMLPIDTKLIEEQIKYLKEEGITDENITIVSNRYGTIVYKRIIDEYVNRKYQIGKNFINKKFKIHQSVLNSYVDTNIDTGNVVVTDKEALEEYHKFYEDVFDENLYNDIFIEVIKLKPSVRQYNTYKTINKIVTEKINKISKIKAPATQGGKRKSKKSQKTKKAKKSRKKNTKKRNRKTRRH